MRLRSVAVASLVALVAAAAAGVASAAPSHNRGLTINVIPNPIQAGETVYIYGQLHKAPVGGQTIILYHHLAGSHEGYTKVGQTETDSSGFYQFKRNDGVVVTNRSWFVREAGTHGIHSRTVYERVQALVGTPTPSTTNGYTNHRIVFTGHVTPNNAGATVLLQEQIGSSDDWRTLKAGRLGPGSNYSLAYRWSVPGQRDVRVAFTGDVRNIRSVSDPITVTIQQAQVKDFTINTSAPVIDYGQQSATITGVLDKPGTTTPEPSTPVVLCGRTARQSKFACSTVTATGSDGSYSFTVSPAQNTVYQVRTSLPPRRHTAELFEGVRDIVTISASSTSSTVGGKVTFSGTVTPEKAGHVIYLQRLGSDGDWHTEEVTTVKANSTYQFSWTFGNTGTKEFRARITSDASNVGSASPPVTVMVGPNSSPANLPAAS